MKFSLSWLKSHLETEASLDQIATTLSAIGLEVEGVEDRAAPLKGFRTAKIIAAEQHPNADRLRVCQVDTGEKILNIVCGAPNARAGIVVVLAQPGAVVPSTGTVLKLGEIRGVPSQGMMCSTRELNLGEDHDGIIELPEATGLGIEYAEILGLNDPVIEIGVTPNRGDCFGVRGVARDLAAAGLGKLIAWNPAPVAGSGASAVRWVDEFTEACPWIIGRSIRGVKNFSSPRWLRDRLKAAGINPKNALVDITNYFSLDLGRPLHVFDVGRLAGDTITVRRGAGESFTALSGKVHQVDAEDCVMSDGSGVISLAGVMGGESTGCSEFTTDVFVEAALFDPVRIALTGRRHQVVSDARQRFERGVDQALLPKALDAATALIIELCGGEASEVSVAGAEPAWQRSATLRFARLRDFGGSDVSADEAVARLERLGFTVTGRDEQQVTVAVPPWRNDVAPAGTLDQAPGLDALRAAKAAEGAAAMEAEADLIEEVLRLAGLDAVPAVSLPVSKVVPDATLSAKQVRAQLARRTLAAGGLLETVGFSFVARDQAALFGENPRLSNSGKLEGTLPDGLRLLNPIAADLDQLRPTPVVSLALVAARNQARGLPGSGVFEIGPGFAAEGQFAVAALVRAGISGPSWIESSRAPDAFDAKADVFALLAALGVPLESLSVTADAPGYYHPGRSGVVRQGPKVVLARFGELHPAVRAGLGLDQPAVAAEVLLDAIPEPKRKKKSAPDIATLQPIRRDFAFVVDAGVAADAVLRAAKGAERALIAGVALFDVYHGDKIAEGKKSLAIQVTLQPREKSLTDAEIDAVSAKIVAAVSKATGAVLR